MKKNLPKNNNLLNIKQSTYDLIPQIKELAKKMSQKEVEEKLKINKKTLKKIKDAEDIKFRTSYLSFGVLTKKSIPYAERYTADEKSKMYRKRKENETLEDKINKRERDIKYYKELKKDKKRLENKRQRDRKSAINRWNNLSQEDWEDKKQRDREYQAKRKEDLN
jgi:hypothetical protein